MLLTHNHPGGRSFSLTDVMLARKVELRELRAVTARQRFLIMPPEGGWASVGMEEFSATLNREKVLLLAELRDQIAKHRLTSAMVDLSFHQRLWERIAEAGLLRYRVESW
jgi:hypothetical protein